MQTRVLLCKAACLCLLFCAGAQEPDVPLDERDIGGCLSIPNAKKIYAKHCDRDGLVISVNFFTNTAVLNSKTSSGYSILHLPLGLTPLWELSSLKTTKILATLIVPLKGKSAQVAQMIHHHGTKEEYRTPATIDISLIIQSTLDGKQNRLYVETQISDSPTNYKESSYILISSALGKYVYAYRWLKGQRSVVTLIPGDAASGEVRDSTGNGVTLLRWDSIGDGGCGGRFLPLK